MNKEKCVICGKPMDNSLSNFKVDSDYIVPAHKKCQEYIKCKNCISMMIRGIEGECICGNIVNMQFKK